MCNLEDEHEIGKVYFLPYMFGFLPLRDHTDFKNDKMVMMIGVRAAGLVRSRSVFQAALCLALIFKVSCGVICIRTADNLGLINTSALDQEHNQEPGKRRYR